MSLAQRRSSGIEKKKERIGIKGVDPELKQKLKLMAQEKRYDSLSQFLIDQLEKIVSNHGVDYYDNEFSKYLIQQNKKIEELIECQKEEQMERVKMNLQLKEIEQYLITMIQLFDLSENETEEDDE